MKSYAVLILMALSVAIATLLHSTHGDGTKGIDTMQRSLGDLQRRITPGSHISFRTAPDNPEVLAKARFILAPTIIDPGSNDDTTLVITSIMNTDSVISIHPVWQNQDSQYHYSLIVK